MFEIPIKLMITPPLCRECADLKDVYEDNGVVFRGNDDLILSLFIMHELLKGDDSFWAPYFRILPHPGSIADWTPAELTELQNQKLVTEASQRHPQHLATYNKLFQALDAAYPGRFPVDKYTYESFEFALLTVAARAFGRRLPWTALVPFADCLNHSNVQTKYDYDVDGNGMFRMCPTGTNKYPKVGGGNASL